MLDLPQIRRKPRKTPYHKPEAVKELERLADAEALRLHPTCPHLAKCIFRDDTSNSLTQCIVKYVTLKGGFASRINNQGTFNVKLRRFIPSTSKRGLPDIQILLKGKFIACEIKIKNDRQSEYQKKIEAEVIRSGGYYYLARDFESFRNWFDTM
jgi:hypothetical protein